MRKAVSGLPCAFWWLWTSILVTRLGSFVAPFLVLYLTTERGWSASSAGGVAALYGAGGAAASLAGGVLADRVGRHTVLLVTQPVAAGLTAALGFADQPALIAVLACAVGAAGNASRPVVQTVLADVVAPADQARAFSLYYWALNIGFAVASASAGFLASYGYRWLFLAEALTLLLSTFVISARLPETRTAPAQIGEPGADRQSGGLRTVLRDRPFLAVVGLAFALVVVFQQASVGLPIAMHRDGLTAAQYGLVISVNGLLIVGLQLPLGRALHGSHPRRPLILAALLCGWGFGLAAFAGGAAVYAVSVVVWTLGELVHAPLNMQLVARHSPGHARGRYQGVYTMAWSTATITAPLAGGTVIDRFGPDALWAACAAAGTCAAVGYWALLSEPDRHRPASSRGSTGRQRLQPALSRLDPAKRDSGSHPVVTDNDDRQACNPPGSKR
ncbi:MDR family MFS transporter [Streptomyces griseorubiginosus]|uniref:MDR family MFS transporter n=1 Tax=Streptomyces griseorubiginosus TaxID=67304 RepID=UPI003691FAF7